MRLLDYQRYTVEVGEGYVFFEAPLRDKPSGNRLERAYQRMVRPMPGLGAADRRVWRYVFLWPNTTIDLYPDQVTTWQINPRGIGATHDVWACYRAGEADRRRCAPCSGSTTASTSRSPTRTPTWSPASRPAWRRRGWTPGPLGEREAAVAWFADRVRRALEATG